MRNWFMVLFLVVVVAALAYFVVLMLAPPGPGANRNPHANGSNTGTDTNTPDPTPDPDPQPGPDPDPANQPDPDPDPQPDPDPDPGPRQLACTGTVTDADGQPIAGAVVTWQALTNDGIREMVEQTLRQQLEWFTHNGGSPEQMAFAAVTNAAGEFRLVWDATLFGADPSAFPTDGSMSGVLMAGAFAHDPAGQDVAWGTEGPVTFQLQPRTGIHLTVLDDETEKPVQTSVFSWSSPEPEDEQDFADIATLMRLTQRLSNSPGAERYQPQDLATRDDGTLVIPTTEDRYYHLIVRSQQHLHTWRQNIRVAAGSVEKLEIRLALGRALVGRVVDQNDRGVPNAAVRIGDSRIGWQLGDAAFLIATTDLDGNFRITGLPDDPDVALGANVSATGYLPYMETLEPGTSSPVTLMVQRLGMISGRVVDEAGQLLAPPTVRVSAHHDASGRVDPRFGGFSQGTVEWYWVNAEGLAIDPEGKPDARYEMPGSWLAGNDHVVQSRGMGMGMGRTRTVIEAEDASSGHEDANRFGDPPPGGRLAFRAVGLSKGTWNLVAEGDEYSPSKAGPHQVEDGQAVRDVVITLKTGAVLTGVVTRPDGSPAADASVWVGEPVLYSLDGVTPDSPVDKIPDEPAPAWSKEAITDENGRYRITAMPAGEAMVIVAAAGHAVHESRVSIPETGEIEHNVAVAEGLTVTGRVMLADGSPAKGAEVTVQYGERRSDEDLRGGGGGNWQSWQKYQQVAWFSNQWTSMCTTCEVNKETGEFVVRGLMPGRYSLSANAPGGVEAMVNVTAGDTGVELRLGAVGAIVGTLRCPDGSIPESGTITIANPESFVNRSYPFGRHGAIERDLDATEQLPGGEIPPDDMPFFQGEYGNEFQWNPETGEFRIGDVAVGRYIVGASSEGYAAVYENGVAVAAAGETRIALVLAEPFRLEVTVLDPTGVPIADANVQLEGRVEGANPWMIQQGGSFSMSATTDAAGRAMFEGITMPLVTVTASAANFSTQSVPADVRTDASIEVKLSLGGSVEGIVRDKDGRPMSGTMVVGVNQTGGGMRNQQMATTDKTGHYRIDNLAPGNWIIAVQALRDEESQMPAFRMVLVKAGEVTRADFGDEAGALECTVSGRVTRGGEPMAQTQLGFFRPGGQMIQKMVQTDETGHYEVTMPPGDVLVFQGGNTQRVRIKVPETPTARIDIEMPNATVTGTIRDSAGRPLAGVRVELSKASNGKAANALDMLDEMIPIGTAQTNPDGTYEMNAIPPGTYDLWVRTGMMGAGVTNADGQPIAVTHGGTVTVNADGHAQRDVTVDVAGTLTIKLEGYPREAFATAELNVRDSKGRTVPLQDMQFGQPAISGPVTTLSNMGAGRYTIRLHVPGRAWAEKSATVQAGSTTEVVFVAEPGANVNVIVESSSGAPVPLAGWSLEDANGRNITPRPNLMELMGGGIAGLSDGRITVPDLAPGKYTIEVRPQNGEPARREITISGTETRELRITAD